MLNLTLKWVKRLVVIVIGVTVMLIGVALLVLPGPGTVVIVAGLAILATEVVWARVLLQRAKRSAQGAVDLMPPRWKQWVPFFGRRSLKVEDPSAAGRG